MPIPLPLIMVYTKPFGNDSFIGRLTHNEISCKLNKKEKMLYKQLKDWRNKIYAHADIKYIQVHISESNRKLKTQTNFHFIPLHELDIRTNKMKKSTIFVLMGKLINKTLISIQENKNNLLKSNFDSDDVRKRHGYQIYLKSINEFCINTFKKISS